MLNSHPAHFLSLFLAFQQSVGASLTRVDLHKRYGDFSLHEKRDFGVEGRRLEGNIHVPLRIALKQQNLQSLANQLLAVSDPHSPLYGQHWTQAQILEAFSPSDDTHGVVRDWLRDAGFHDSAIKLSYNEAWIEVDGATARHVEELLATEYRVFEHGDEEHVACHNYSLPVHVAKHVDFVVPTIQPHIKLSTNNDYVRNSLQPRMAGTSIIRRSSTIAPLPSTQTRSLTGCDKMITPNCLKTLYNMSYTPKATDKNTFGITSYFSNTYLQSDLDTFFSNFSPALVGKSPSLVSINGGSIELDPTSDVGEDGWILQYSMTLAAPQNVQLLQINNPQIERFTFNAWLDAVDGSYCSSDGGDDFNFDPQLPNPLPGGFNDHSCGTVKAPFVVSNSQSFSENQFSEFYRQRQCAEFGKLGLMGTTILYAAGNTGVTGAQSGYCLDENGSMNLNATNFNPNWPASCPWVTVVGGTQVKANASLSSSMISTAEEVWNQEIIPGFFESGGGGFSNQFPRPSYQEKSVNSYLSFLRRTDPKKLQNFNVKGRAYPDLSANANSFLDIANGTISIDSGTSGATPTVAAIITLVNDARLAAGKKPVGFINPSIYSPAFASAFNDVVDGVNTGCKGLQGVRDGGFRATTGWDPASGLGTPNLGKLIEKWLALP
ncbi:subtilisin-like protein [Agrocybe pediades]|nr:subtilisin-like protein [Agrocybe pediades]